jgi:hypothetical protein
MSYSGFFREHAILRKIVRQVLEKVKTCGDAGWIEPFVPGPCA